MLDSKAQKHGRPVALGEFSLPLATLLLQPNMLFANPLPLTNRDGFDAYIYLAIALRVRLLYTALYTPAYSSSLLS